MSKKNSKAVAYIRTNSATNVGADGDSLEFQKTAIYAYAKAAGYEIVATCHADAASGGADPMDGDGFGYAKMLERLLSEGAQTIIVESPDRFARDLVVQLAGHEALRAEGISLIAASAPTYFVEATPTAVLVRHVLNTVARFNRQEGDALFQAGRGARVRYARRDTGRGRRPPRKRLPDPAEIAT
jgi:DNA invertase Pin-like site-specific DNA recombinase